MADDDKEPAPPQPPGWVPDQVWDMPYQRRNNALYDSQPNFVPPPQPLPQSPTHVIQGGPPSPVTVDADVIPAPEVRTVLPFSEVAIAERLASDPEFYRRLFRFAADESKREIDRFEARPGEGNSAAIISAELIEFQRGFEAAATDLESENPDRFARAAKTIVAIRDSIGRVCENYPILARTFFQLPAVTLGVYVLHQVGVPAELGALISAAIVRNEKLADLLGRRSKEDKDENPPT